MYKVFSINIYGRSLASSKSEHEVESGLFLNVVVTKGSSVLELFAGEDQSLLIGRDSLLILDLGLHVLDCVGCFDVKSDGLASQGLDEDLHTSSESQNEMKG